MRKNIKSITMLLIITILSCCRFGYAAGITETFHGIATVIISRIPNVSSSGTGFYYNRYYPKDQKLDSPDTSRVQSCWLITNRHVLVPKINEREIFPDSVTFHLRRISNDKIAWEPVSIDRAELLKRARFHQNKDVDVCAIEIMDLIKYKFIDGGKYMKWSSVSENDYASDVETADDIVVIGFPRLFYDQANLYPIVKQGIIASRWGAKFNGQPYFLIDAKLFPGSSGSIVVTKPKDTLMENGMLKAKVSGDKMFQFLGIYSGEPIPKEDTIELDGLKITAYSGVNVGIVWYGSLIKEIIEHGVPYNDSK